MRATAWAALGILCLVFTCVFPPLIIGVLVCFIGMVIAIQVKPPQQLAGFQTGNGLVQVSTNAHWSSFERPVGEFAAIYRLPMNALSDADRAKVIDNMRIGEVIGITHKRTKDERGVIRDSLVLTGASGVVLGTVPAQLESEYMQAFKAENAGFRARVHHIATDTREPVVLAHFERVDKAYLDRVQRAKEIERLKPYTIIAGACALVGGIVWVLQHYTG